MCVDVRSKEILPSLLQGLTVQQVIRGGRVANSFPRSHRYDPQKKLVSQIHKGDIDSKNSIRKEDLHIPETTMYTIMTVASSMIVGGAQLYSN